MTCRDPYLLTQDLARYRKLQPHLFPTLETTPDLPRGEIRLAAEVALAAFHGNIIPESARIKAFETLSVLAKG